MDVDSDPHSLLTLLATQLRRLGQPMPDAWRAACPPPVLFDEKSPAPLYGLPAVDLDNRHMTSYPRDASNKPLFDQRRRFELELLSWTALRNADLPIHTLPAEVLLQIFKEFLLPVNPSTVGHPVYAGYDTAKAKKRPWARFMGVCRHWCALIRNTGCFWRDVVVAGETRWLDLALRRLGKRPLRVWIKSDRRLEETISTLVEHSDHIELLDIPATVYDSNPCLLNSLLHRPYPMLSSLELLLRRPEEDQGQMHLSCDYYPRITSLRLACTSLQWTASLLENLRVLSLSSCQLATSPIPLPEFLAVLEYGQHLELLSLGSFLSFALEPQGSASRERLIALPRLRHLSLSEAPVDIARLLRYIRIPDTCRIYLEGQCGEVDDPSISYDSMLPPDRARIPFLPSITDVSVTIVSSENRILCRDLPCELSLHSSAHRAAWDFWLDTGLRQFTGLFSHAGSSLTSLNIIGMLDVLPSSTWDALFAAFPALQTLTLYTCKLQIFPTSVTHSLSTPAANEHGIPEALRFRCPNLKRLEIRGWEWDSLAVEAVLDCLGSRAALGAPKLEVLCLGAWWHGGEEEERARAWAWYLPRLRAAVGQFHKRDEPFSLSRAYS